MTATPRHELTLIVMILATIHEGLGSVLTILHGDASLERSRRDIWDALERERANLEHELWIEHQAAKEREP
jgi:hypothetical protein